MAIAEFAKQSSRPSRARKPTKPANPYVDFPLFAHASGRWAKKIHGKFHFFGSWANGWQTALDKFVDQRDALYARRKPRPRSDEATIRDLLNRFRITKRDLRDAAEIVPVTYNDYVVTCDTISDAFGLDRTVVDLAADDFEKLRADLPKRLGPVALGNQINRIRMVFKYAFDVEMMTAPIRFGPGFKRPSRRILRRARLPKGPRMFEAAEIRSMLEKAPVSVKAMILLAINCGFGNNDVARLPISAVDLKSGWLDFPRPKTAVPRRCPLWTETIKAIKARPAPKDPANDGLLFVTLRGNRRATTTSDNPVSKECVKLLKELGYAVS